MTKRGLSILFFVALALQASAAALYVRPGGSINRNLAMCKPGDTLFVKEGVYHEAVVLKDGCLATAIVPFPRLLAISLSRTRAMTSAAELHGCAARSRCASAW